MSRDSEYAPMRHRHTPTQEEEKDIREKPVKFEQRVKFSAGLLIVTNAGH